MADPLRQSALAHLHLIARAEASPSEAGVVMGERGFRSQWTLRGHFEDEVFTAAMLGETGSAPPLKPNTVHASGKIEVLWLGPDEWLVVGPDESDVGQRLSDAIKDTHAAATDVSESRTVIALSGLHARDVLAKGCALDLHPSVFAAGQCAQSTLGHVHVILHQRSEAPEFDIYVHRSFAEALWQWLEDAAAEYGLAISNPS